MRYHRWTEIFTLFSNQLCRGCSCGGIHKDDGYSHPRLKKYSKPRRAIWTQSIRKAN